ncbi:MAG TPA: hypothetical protein VNK96_05390 [Fimbriimonadales bacterium]|nr:hypothetical protein [Fimbriimonadales bacterium]
MTNRNVWAYAQKLLLPVLLLSGGIVAITSRAVPAAQLTMTRAYDPLHPGLFPDVMYVFWSNFVLLLAAGALAWAAWSTFDLKSVGRWILIFAAVLSLFIPYEEGLLRGVFLTVAMVSLLFVIWSAFRRECVFREKLALAFIGLTFFQGHLRFLDWVEASGISRFLIPSVEISAILTAVFVFWAWGSLKETSRKSLYWAFFVTILFLLAISLGDYAGPAFFFGGMGLVLWANWALVSLGVFLYSFTVISSFSRGRYIRALALSLLPIAGFYPLAVHQSLLALLAVVVLSASLEEKQFSPVPSSSKKF